MQLIKLRLSNVFCAFKRCPIFVFVSHKTKLVVFQCFCCAFCFVSCISGSGSPGLGLCGWQFYSLNVISRMSVAFSASKTLLETYCSILYINSRYCCRNLAQTSGNHFLRVTRGINGLVLSSRFVVIVHSHCSNYLPVLYFSFTLSYHFIHPRTRKFFPVCSYKTNANHTYS